MDMMTNFTTNFRTGDLKLSLPPKPEILDETELTPTDEVKTGESSEVDSNAAYEKAYAEAVEKLETYIRENAPRKVDSPQEAFSVTQDFTVNGQKYYITAKPTYYKAPNGAYYLHDPRNAGSIDEAAKIKIDYSVEAVPENFIRNYVRLQGDVNIDNYGDNPSYWQKAVGNQIVGSENGEKASVPVFRYDYEMLNSHLPSDIIEQFFEQDPEFPEGYRLKDNCKKIELYGNYEPPQYRIIYTDENGKEKEMIFANWASTEGNGIAAHIISDVGVEEKEQRAEKRAQQVEKMTQILKQFGALASIKKSSNIS